MSAVCGAFVERGAVFAGIRAAFEFGVFIGEQPVFEAKTLNRDDLSKITLTINPDFDWTKCDWDEWNTKKI